MANVEPRKPWHRRPNELTKHHEWFMIYASLEPKNRSVPEAYRKFRGNEGIVKAPPTWWGAFRRHNWEARADALYDEMLDAKIDGLRRGTEESWARAAEDAARIFIELMEKDHALATKLDEMLEQELTKDNFSFGHVVQFMKLRIELYRIAIERAHMHSQAEPEQVEEVDPELVARIMARVRPLRAEQLPGDDDILDEGSGKPHPDLN